MIEFKSFLSYEILQAVWSDAPFYIFMVSGSVKIEVKLVTQYQKKQKVALSLRNEEFTLIDKIYI